MLKPASLTPSSALAIGEALAGAGRPAGAFSVLPARGADAEALATDPRVAKLSFTGSDVVGWRLHALAGRKRCTLELGGNAAVIVDETGDIERAAHAIVRGAFGQAGQSCISVQRILATSEAHAALKDDLVDATREVRAGDPREEGVLVGPMITEREAERVETWIAEAVVTARSSSSPCRRASRPGRGSSTKRPSAPWRRSRGSLTSRQRFPRRTAPAAASRPASSPAISAARIAPGTRSRSPA